MKLKIGITMRITESSDYYELRNSIAVDWIDFLNLHFSEYDWILLPNSNFNIMDYLKSLGINCFFLVGGEDIRVAKYSLFGSKTLSKNIIKAIKNRKSCLISNHGQISIGNSIESAYELAEEVEKICEYYYYCKLNGNPKNLSKNEMQQVLNKIFDYKQE